MLALPEDVLSSDYTGAPVVPAATLPSGKAAESDVAAIVDALAKAERPLAIVGGGGWSQKAAQALGRFADKAALPVGASFRCQDYLDNRHSHYVGDVGIGINPKLAERVKHADVILSLGARLGEMTTSGYTLLTPPLPRQTLIHVHADAAEIGRVYRPALGVVANAAELVCQLADAARSPASPRDQWISGARSDYEAWQQPQETPGELKMEQVISHLNEALGEDAILTNGAGNYSAWLHRYYRYRHWPTQLAPTSGSMGYGLPAAIAAKLRHPEREVVCLAGDGCFQMVMQEFGVACQYGANVIVLVSNNGMYGTIRMHQERNYPDRPSGTRMHNPDFAAFARSYGGFGATVTSDREFPAALQAAREAGVPAILDLKVDPHALSPKLTLAHP